MEVANYIAKKVTLDLMRECNRRGCGVYTRAGYYIHYKNSNVDSILFVCEDCFAGQYRSKCSLGDFQETEYISNPRRMRYTCGSFPKIATAMNRGIRTIRKAMVLVLIFLLVAFFTQEQPSVRSEFTTPEINSVNWDGNAMINCFKRIGVQIERVITHGGN